MNRPDKKIIDFINEHHVLTLATCSDNKAWCANCFYVFLKNENVFVFTSDSDTKHIMDARKQKMVAASIVLETKTIGKIQGLQITGTLELAEGEMLKMAKKAYLMAFPYAVLMKTKLWILNIDYAKLTDNRLGFGKKIIWQNSLKSDNK